MFQAPAPAENPAEFQRITQIPRDSPTQSANHAKFAQFAPISRELCKFCTLRTKIQTYVIDFQISDNRQRTEENWSESTRFRSIRPPITRITPIPRISQ